MAIKPLGNVIIQGSASDWPNSLIHLYPGDEGSGDTLNDNEGSENISLTEVTWEANADFEGGEAIVFDRIDDSIGDGQLDQPNSRTRIVRVAADDMADGDTNFNSIFTHGGSGGDESPFLAYHQENEEWEFRDGNGDSVSVSEPIEDVESETRIVVIRVDSDEARLDVYDNDYNSIGNDTLANPDTTYGTGTFYLGAYGDNTRAWNGQMDPQLSIFNEYLSDTDLDTVLEDQY